MINSKVHNILSNCTNLTFLDPIVSIIFSQLSNLQGEYKGNDSLGEAGVGERVVPAHMAHSTGSEQLTQQIHY